MTINQIREYRLLICLLHSCKAMAGILPIWSPGVGGQMGRIQAMASP